MWWRSRSRRSAGSRQVTIGGQQKPAIRVQVDPAKLQARGLTFEDVRSVLDIATTDAAKGSINGNRQTFTIAANDQLTQPDQFNDVIIAYRNGAPVRIRDVGQAVSGPAGREPAALFRRQSRRHPPRLQAAGRQRHQHGRCHQGRDAASLAIAPQGFKLDTILDRTQTIRASVRDVEFTLGITIGLVVMVILCSCAISGRRSFPA